MSIRVLDPAGRVLRPISAANAKSKVKCSYAEWLHAPGIKPNLKHGTIILKNHVKKNPPLDCIQTQVFNGDGQFLGFIWKEMACAVLEKKQCISVGTNMPSGLRAVIIPRLINKAAMRELRHIEARRTAEAAIKRSFLRDKIEKIINNAANWTDVEIEVDSLLEQHLGLFEKEVVLSDIKLLRKKIAALDLAFASDMVAVRNELVRKHARA